MFGLFCLHLAEPGDGDVDQDVQPLEIVGVVFDDVD